MVALPWLREPFIKGVREHRLRVRLLVIKDTGSIRSEHSLTFAETASPRPSAGPALQNAGPALANAGCPRQCILGWHCGRKRSTEEKAKGSDR